ncbi:hypothetical protein EJ08DRAFT_664497 [Tothia fuscella]|uniref:WW domain-containing protein n=1 Tax=Tothia fuscella TaxID=1048955 RepID=A0A9P4TUR3_9PEZI|nr:hypothetical protein EJ08DRAFT_664497 [Tothia fuscella]
MATNPQYELGILAGGTWKQWSSAAGQDYYEFLSTRATQYMIPVGWTLGQWTVPRLGNNGATLELDGLDVLTPTPLLHVPTWIKPMCRRTFNSWKDRLNPTSIIQKDYHVNFEAFFRRG